MLQLAVKAVISAILIVAVSEIAKRSPTFGALAASLPLVSLVAILWLWRDTGDAARIAAQSEATFWYVLPSLPMFLGDAGADPRRPRRRPVARRRRRADDRALPSYDRAPVAVRRYALKIPTRHMGGHFG